MSKILKLREKISKLKKLLETPADNFERKRLEREIKTLTKRATIVTYRDLRIESPYNTYLVYGLPPSPICNPGLNALKAALRPKQTPYLFYFWVPDENRHDFSTSYTEHINKLRRVRTRNRIRN
jgi:cell division protein YceG involved in septum cleavage